MSQKQTSSAIVKAEKKAAKPAALTDSPEAQAVARFSYCHKLAQVRGLQFKLSAYFAGMEVQTLAELHGVSQGKGKDGEPWGAYVQRMLNIPYSTAQRYRAHYQSIASEHGGIAIKLNNHWLRITSGEECAALISGGDDKAHAVDLPAKALQSICDHADEWGLHALFAKPERDVTPDDGDDGDDTENARARRKALVMFWNDQVLRRMAADEYLRLPKAQLAAFATRAEEAAKKAREALAGPKKKGGK